MTTYKLTDFNGNQIPISDQNLVINGDFKVWQRQNNDGYVEVSQTTPTYTADRWLFTTNATSKNVYHNETGGLNFLCSTNKQHVLRQWIEMNNDLINELNGKDVTLSFKVVSTVITSIQIGVGIQRTIKPLVVGENLITQTYTLTDDDFETNGLQALICNITPTGELYLTFKYAKLEQGSIATPFVPRLMAEEFPLSQRYEQISNYVHGMGIAYYGSVLLYLPLSCPLRATPKISFSGTVSAIRDGIDSQNITSMSYVGHSDSLVIISCATSGSVENGTVWRIEGGKIELDAEIY